MPDRKSRSHTFGMATIAALLVLVTMQFLVFAQKPATAANTANYKADATASVKVLQGWYNSSNGQFNTTGWWNAANALGAIIDYSSLTGDTTYTGDIATTFSKNSNGNFLNNFYDDEGWWGLTWVKAYDYTGNTSYLNMAKTIFNDMKAAWNTTCNGGIWWSKDRNYKNAIANELFFTLSARLHERTANDGGSGSYLDWANREWSWFSNSGMINSSNLVNDGLTSACRNNGQTTWTYNQGVLLGALTDMYKITANTTYLTKAEAIANAATSKLVNANGVLKEPCECGGGDVPQFKGVFMRNLAYLYQVDHQQAYENFILNTADSIWQKDRDGSNHLGQLWYGPFDSADAARQSSAQDALNAAIPFSAGPNNLALNKSATANGTCSANETPAKAVDGSVTNDSKWCAGATNGQYWLQIDLGSTTTVGRFVIYHAGAGGENAQLDTRDFTLQTSTDASHWTTVVTVTGNTSDITTNVINSAQARYIRLNITRPQTSTQYVAARIYELEVFSS